MGIKNLLPTLKGIQKNIHISKYAGKKVAVDGHVWLHSAAYNCASDLALGLPTDSYLGFFKKRIDMLRFFGVEPIIVFDGQRLPQKDHITKEREAKRQQALKNGFAYLKIGRAKAADMCFKESIKITSEMIYTTIQFLDTLNVQHIVAPYEADPQLTYLVNSGQVSAVITVDSDLLTFGCSNVVFKMDKEGNAVEVKYADICPYLSRHPTHIKKIFATRKTWNPDMFRYMCVMAGCDYLEPLPKYTISKARQFVEYHNTPNEIIQTVKNMYSKARSEQYEIDFYKADAAYKYQFVFDPNTRTYCRLNALPTTNVGFVMDDVSKLGESPQNKDIPLLRSNRAIYLDFDAIKRNANKENIDPNGVVNQASVQAKPTENAPLNVNQKNVNTRLSSVNQNIQKPLSAVNVNQQKTNTTNTKLNSVNQSGMKPLASRNVNQQQNLILDTSATKKPMRATDDNSMKRLSAANTNKSVSDIKKNTLSSTNTTHQKPERTHNYKKLLQTLEHEEVPGWMAFVQDEMPLNLKKPMKSADYNNMNLHLSINKHQQKPSLNASKKSVKFVDENSNSSFTGKQPILSLKKNSMKASSSMSLKNQAPPFDPIKKPSSFHGHYIPGPYESELDCERLGIDPNGQSKPYKNQVDEMIPLGPKKTIPATQEIPTLEELLPPTEIPSLKPPPTKVLSTAKVPPSPPQASMFSSQASSQISAFDDDINEEDLVHLAEKVEAAIPSPSMPPSRPTEAVDNEKAAQPPQSSQSSSQIPSLDDDLDLQLFHLAEQVEAEVLPTTNNISVAMPNNQDIPLQITTCKIDSAFYKINGVNYNPICITSSASPTTNINHHMSVHDMAYLITKCMAGDQRAIKTRESQLQKEDEARKNTMTENKVLSREARQNIRDFMTIKDVPWRMQPPMGSRKRKADQAEMQPPPIYRQQRNRRV